VQRCLQAARQKDAQELCKNIFDAIGPAQFPSAWRGGGGAASSVPRGVCMGCLLPETTQILLPFHCLSTSVTFGRVSSDLYQQELSEACSERNTVKVRLLSHQLL